MDHIQGLGFFAPIAGDPTILENQQNYEWIHPLSEIFGSLLGAGMTITMFHEHEVLPWRAVPSLVPASPRTWRLPDGHPRLPLAFSLRARKTRPGPSPTTMR